MIGILVSRTVYITGKNRPPEMQHASPYNIMTKPIGPRCNIDCEYCYYLEKEKLFPSEKKFRMAPEVLETYVRQMIEASIAAGMGEVQFAWQGGEPTLLGIDYFRQIVALQKNMCLRAFL